MVVPRISDWTGALARIGADPEDEEELRQKKALLSAAKSYQSGCAFRGSSGSQSPWGRRRMALGIAWRDDD
jgi:hypothetical protein